MSRCRECPIEDTADTLAPDRSLNDLSYSLRRHFVDGFLLRHVPLLRQGSLLLDLGGDRIRKRGKFDIGRFDFTVVYANLSLQKLPSVQCDAARLPFGDCRFDAVICSELMEHLPDPLRVLAEIARVTRHGGHLLLCAPFLYRIHADPEDFGRYTDRFWERNLRDAGFHEIAIERHGLWFSVMADFLRQYVRQNEYPRPTRWVAAWVAAKAGRWALRRELDPRVRGNPFLASFTTGFGVIATKA